MVTKYAAAIETVDHARGMQPIVAIAEVIRCMAHGTWCYFGRERAGDRLLTSVLDGTES